VGEILIEPNDTKSRQGGDGAAALGRDDPVSVGCIGLAGAGGNRKLETLVPSEPGMKVGQLGIGESRADISSR
jgi:hypothetical protein